MVNNKLARVHMVEGAAFLVSPEIFKLYIKSTTGEIGDEWRRLQKEFQKLELHRRGDDGINIWTIEVRGLRKAPKVKGFLLDNPQEIFGRQCRKIIRICRSCPQTLAVQGLSTI